MIYGCSLDAMAGKTNRKANKGTDIGKKNEKKLKKAFREHYGRQEKKAYAK